MKASGCGALSVRADKEEWGARAYFDQSLSWTLIWALCLIPRAGPQAQSTNIFPKKEHLIWFFFLNGLEPCSVLWIQCASSTTLPTYQSFPQGLETDKFPWTSSGSSGKEMILEGSRSFPNNTRFRPWPDQCSKSHSTCAQKAALMLLVRADEAILMYFMYRPDYSFVSIHRGQQLLQ